MPPGGSPRRRGAEFTYTMKTALQMYGAFLAGVLSAAGLAYWYYVEHYEGG